MIKESVIELVGLVENGKLMDAFEKFYAEDVVMEEPFYGTTKGKEANRARELAFLESVAEVHENKATNIVVDGNNSAVEWVLELTNKEGKRLRFEQLTMQNWKDGKIVHERFYYDLNSVAN